MFRLFNNPFEFLGIFAAFLVAITVHECAHAWTSDRLGDPTAKLMGRLTLNPFAHLDLLGTLMILFAPFGWAKPVQVDPFNLRNPRRDEALISLAGPAANIITAVVFSIFLQIMSAFTIGLLSTSLIFALITTFIKLIIIYNVNLALFNLIPIHPLDGFAVVHGLLSEKYALQWKELERYGIIFLLFLVFPLFGTASPILNVVSAVSHFILSFLIPGTAII